MCRLLLLTTALALSACMPYREVHTMVPQGYEATVRVNRPFDPYQPGDEVRCIGDPNWSEPICGTSHYWRAVASRGRTLGHGPSLDGSSAVPPSRDSAPYSAARY